ncbi:hypothetical protein Tco_1548864 [Tanacetum coccineum]
MDNAGDNSSEWRYPKVTFYKVMELKDEINWTPDISNVYHILASSCEMKDDPWIQNVAKFHMLHILDLRGNS